MESRSVSMKAGPRNRNRLSRSQSKILDSRSSSRSVSIILGNALLFLVLFSCLINFSSGALSFLQWSDKCKIPVNNEILRPNEECDSSRGLICQKYSQGSYCGCLIGGPLSYDRQSKECRRKVTSFCSYEAADEILNQLSFNQKCHAWADCIKVNLTAVSGRKNDNDAHVCMCKEGYISNKDFTECEKIKTSGAGSISISISLWTGLIFIPSFLSLLFKILNSIHVGG